MLLILMCALSGCAGLGGQDALGPAPRGYYRIKSGDTLSEIAHRRRLPMRKLAAWNQLEPPYSIYAGDLLRVRPPPAPMRTATVAPPASTAPMVTRQSARTQPAQQTGARSTATGSLLPPAEPGDAVAASGLRWQWPVTGPLHQTYAAGDRTRSGVRIGVAPGTPVGAAAAGTVVYSGSGLTGYGNLIIVQHDPRYLSAYAYNRRLLVNEGEQVRRGQVIAETGAAVDGQALLHFEIRRDGSPVDPLRYLPASR